MQAFRFFFSDNRPVVGRKLNDDLNDYGQLYLGSPPLKRRRGPPLAVVRWLDSNLFIG